MEEKVIDTTTGEITGGETPEVKKTDTLTGLELNPIEIKKEEEPKADYGDLPEDIFEGETISKEKLTTKWKETSEKLTTSEKRINDLRAKLSKAGKPEHADQYFFKNEKFETVVDMPEVKEGLQSLKEKCHERGLGQNEFEFMAEELLTQLRDNGVIDTRSKEEKDKFIQSEKAKLGQNADEIIDNNVNFIKNSKMFNEEEKNIVLNLMGQGAGFIKIIDKLTRNIGNPSPVPLNPTIANDGLPSDVELYAEYMKPETTEFRRQQIMENRHKVGRTGKLSDARNYI